nr:hypothetical protein [Tanacetum cinerariifolium]
FLSCASFTVTYISVYTDSEPYRFYGGSDEEPTEAVYVPKPEYPEYLVPSGDEAQKTVRIEPPMSASMEACIAEHAAASTPPLPVSSLPLPLPLPLTTSPTNTGAPLGYREAGIRMRSLLPSTYHRTDIPEAEMPPQKRDCFTTHALGLELGESSAASVTRQSRRWVMGLHTLGMRLLEATYDHRTWTSFEDKSAAIESHVKTLKAQNVMQTEAEMAMTAMTQETCGRRKVSTVGGLLDMIHGSVKASKPKTMQEAIEFATELIDKKILTLAERLAENKRKFEDTS